MVDQSGNQFVGYDHASLLKQLQNMANSGIRIESLVVKGHGHELGLYDGMAALFFVPDDNENMILMGDENVLGILKQVTDNHTLISLRGCCTSEAAENTAHRLPGVTVSGSPIPVWGIPWTTWTIGPWINYRYPQSISHSHAK